MTFWRLLAVLVFCLLPVSIVHGATPRVSTGAIPETVTVNEPFQVSVDVHWTGGPQDITVTGVSFGTSPGLMVGAAQHSKTARGEEVTHTINSTLTWSTPGDHVVGPLVLNYRDASGDRLILEVPGSFEMSVSPEAGLGRRGLLLVVVLLGGSGVWLFRRKRRHAEEQTAAAPKISLGERLQVARAYVQRGDAPCALEELIDIKNQLPDGDDLLPPRSELEAELMKLRFGGFAADPYPIERWIRAAEVAARGASGAPHDTNSQGDKDR